jgi:hypothetical protein
VQAPSPAVSQYRNRILDPARQLKTIEQGAATQVWCATNPKLDGIGGVYCENVEVARVVPPDERSGWSSDDSTRKVGVMPYAIDINSADLFLRFRGCGRDFLCCDRWLGPTTLCPYRGY